MKSRTKKSFAVLPMIAALLLTVLAGQLSAQPSPIVPDIGFEIEGNAALDQGGDYDWENAPVPPTVLLADPNSKAEEDPTTLRPDSKFDKPETWSIVPGIVGPGQNELTNLLVWAIPPGDLGNDQPDEFWLVLAMERTKKEGTFDLDFEFNQINWDGSSGGPTRTPGDLVVGFELKGNPTDKLADLQVLIVQYLPGAQPSLCQVTPGVGNEPALVEVGSEPCPPYGDSGFYYRYLADGAILSDSELGQATMNEAPFPALWPSTDSQGNPRTEIGPFEFAEAAINLTELGIEANCSTFSSVHAKSRSSLEVESDLKDIAGPVPLEIMCRLDGHKFLDVNGNGDWDQPDEPPLEGWEIQLSDGSVTMTDENGYYEFESLKDGNYTVSEVCPEAWVQTMPGFTDFDTCGDETYTVEINLYNREVNDLDFGNGEPRLDLTKTCTADVFLGDDIEYEITVTNSGNVNLEDISVQDPIIGLDEMIDLAPGEWETFSGTYPSTSVPGGNPTGPYRVYLPLVVGGSDSFSGQNASLVDPFENTATATSQYALATVEASDSCVTTVHELEVTKDAQPLQERQYLWTIAKTVDDPGPHFLFVGDFVEVEYTVTIDLADPPYIEGAWAVSGTITIDNPAPMDATLTSVTDEISPGISAGVDCPPLTVPAGGSLTCTYGPTELPDASTRTNTATATLLNNNGGKTDFKGIAQVDFADVSINAIDGEVEVSDTFPGMPTEVLGTVRYDEVAKDFVYTRQIKASGDVCELYSVDNEAVFVTNDTGASGSDTSTVEVFPICRVTVAYEDLPLAVGNDWDYNDLVIDVDPVLELSDQRDMLSMSFQVFQEPGAGPQVPLTGAHHQLHLEPISETLSCDGTYTLSRTVAGAVTSASGPYQPGDSIELIEDTEFPPDLVELKIEFDVPSPGACPFEYGDPDPISQYHGEWLFFDPWIYVYTSDEKIHHGEGELEPRILTVPADWQWPTPDGVRICTLYSGVENCVPGPPTFSPFWWNTSPPPP